MNSIGRKVFLGFAQFIVGMCLLLFIPAGTFNYWQAWLLISLYLLASLFIGTYLWKHDRKLLERRLSAGPTVEKEKSQKIIMSFFFFLFFLSFLVPALDYRFAWSYVPTFWVLAGDLLVALGYFVIFLVFKENTFAASTVELALDHKVISTGPYSLVRHPMYSGAIFMFLGTPVALGSWWGLITFIPLMLVLAWRLLEEEKFLVKNLPGYEAYKKQVKFRLIPLLW